MKAGICGILIALCLGVSTADARKDYILKDFRYYKPMIADIRTASNMMRFYTGDPVEFTVPRDGEGGQHLFWDASYGGVIPLVGYNFNHDVDGEPPENPMEIPGIVFFADASAHVLLDFGAASSAVINTDFRIGAGIATRLPGRLRRVSFRYRFFHESTHIGDEYSLFGNEQYGDEFVRYNVAYEAHDFFGSFDRYVPVGEPLLPYRIAYYRFYGGYRMFTHGFGLNRGSEFAPVAHSFPELGERTPPLKSSDYEVQLGGEVYIRAFPEQNGPLLIRRLMFQYVFLAADYYYRDRYAIGQPEQIWSRHIMAGIAYGSCFDGDRDFRVFVSWYDGVNPHGQFRKDTLDFVSVGIASDF